MKITPVQTRIFKENENLAAFVASQIKNIPEESVLVVASKIVALAESRTVESADSRHFDALVRKESALAKKTKHAWLTVKDGMTMANAGIDASNADGKLVLLPKDSYASAAKLRAVLRRRYKIKKLGVIISDSHIAPLRAGVTAHALGYAGIQGVRDYRGKKDLFGREMKISRTNIADSLATAAALLMGEGAEQRPLALITGAPVTFSDKINRAETRISIFEDIYGPLLGQIRKKP